jgi:hypothetical protein
MAAGRSVWPFGILLANSSIRGRITPGRLLFRGRMYQDRVRFTAARDLADDYLTRIKELNLLACFAKRRGAS